jgi:hypothetical protein
MYEYKNPEGLLSTEYNQWTYKYVNWLKEIVLLYSNKRSSSFIGAGLS